MSFIWNSLYVFSLSLSLFMIVFSLYALIKERRHARDRLLSGEKIPPWYINITFRKYIQRLFDGGLLVIVTIGLALFLRHAVFALLIVSTVFFLRACFKIVVISAEMGGRKIAREAGEEPSSIRNNFSFQKEIATIPFLIGIGIVILLNGLVVMKLVIREVVDQISWLWGSLILIGGLYWIIVRTIQIVEASKQRMRSLS